MIFIAFIKSTMRKLLFVLVGLALLTACGQNGALYLPEDAEPPTNSSPSSSEQGGSATAIPTATSSKPTTSSEE